MGNRINKHHLYLKIFPGARDTTFHTQPRAVYFPA